jgi:hypothetical protein
VTIRFSGWRLAFLNRLLALIGKARLLKRACCARIVPRDLE